tara:strand:- start:2350 stop:2733 length:384 start_codon:yes stop_codon:yes gene_type:complete
MFLLNCCTSIDESSNVIGQDTNEDYNRDFNNTIDPTYDEIQKYFDKRTINILRKTLYHLCSDAISKKERQRLSKKYNHHVQLLSPNISKVLIGGTFENAKDSVEKMIDFENKLKEHNGVFLQKLPHT